MDRDWPLHFLTYIHVNVRVIFLAYPDRCVRVCMHYNLNSIFHLL